MKYKLDITATKQTVWEILAAFAVHWCIPRVEIDCIDCPYAKTCDNLHDIYDELLRMEQEREETK